MSLKHIVIALFLYCIRNTYAMELHAQQELFENQQEFSDIDSLEISENRGEVIIQPSLNDKTVVSYDNQAKIIRKGNRLIVEGPRQNFFFSFFSQACRFRINIPVSVTDLKVSIGKGSIIIDGTHLNQLKISGGKVHVLLKEMKGHVNIASGYCALKYFATDIKKGQKAIFECESGKLDFAAFLSDAFTGFCSLIKCGSLQIEESFLPTTAEDKADIVLRGKCGATKVAITKIPMAENAD